VGRREEEEEEERWRRGGAVKRERETSRTKEEECFKWTRRRRRFTKNDEAPSCIFSSRGQLLCGPGFFHAAYAARVITNGGINSS
jgi:hypothetical protein